MNETNRPTVSVIIPTYNRAAMIGRAIESVLHQTHHDFELIVVDDASTDDTEAVIRSYPDSRILYLRHSENRGGSAARNTGIEAARGQYIAFLDSDDEWLPDKLTHQLALLREASKQVGLVYSAFVEVYPDGRTRRHKDVPGATSVGFPSRWLLRNSVFQTVAGFDERMPALQDAEISLRIGQRFSMLRDPRVVMKYHVTSGSICQKAENLQKGAAKLIERYGKLVTSDQLASWYFVFGKASVVEGEIGRGRAALLKAVKLSPFKLRYYPPLLTAMLGSGIYSAVRKLWRRWVRGRS